MYIIMIMYLLLIPCVAFFIKAKHKDQELLAIVLKALSTGIILATGIYGMLGQSGNPSIYALLVVAGIALGLLGDVAICGVFILGMIFFGLGHFAYIAALLRVTTHALWAIPVFIALGLLIFTLYKKSKMSLGKLVIPAVIYCLIIMTMVSLATTAPFSVLPGGAVLFFGAAFFAASDAMLALNKFHADFNKGLVKVDRFNQRAGAKDAFNQKLDTISLSCYYLGQSLFAVSIFCMR